MKTPLKIFISTSSFAVADSSPLDLLKNQGWDVHLNPYGRKLTSDELVTLAQGATGLIAGTERIDEETLARLNGLRAISRCGAGIDNVDVKAAARKGITIACTPFAPVEAVAELTLTLILAALRHVPEADFRVRKSQWKPLMGSLLMGKTVGIVGLGRIGRRVAELLRPFRVKILACDHAPHKSFARRHHVEWRNLPSLLRDSDIVSLHVSLDDTTRGLIGAEELKQMKKTACLINASRGELLDDEALAQALRGGEIAAAALDVFPTEPYSGPLRDCTNTVLTCHMGSYATETRVAMETESARNLIQALR